jgi:tripartite-type tricarboxylate transporter receptor subunit TctC
MPPLSRRAFVGQTALCACAPLSVIADVSAQESDFYRGKTIRILVGGAAGAAYDFVARAVAKYIGRYIAGQPACVVENMPGAASLMMTNMLYNNAPRDGTVIGLPLNGIILEPRLKLLSRDIGNVAFSLERMNWIGTPAQQPQVLWVYHTAPHKTFADLQHMPTTMGATAPGGDNYTLPSLLNALNGTQFKLISGYKAVSDIFLAAEQGEVQGNTANLSTLLGRPDWMSAHKLRILVQFGTHRLPELADVPTAVELSQDEFAQLAWKTYATKFKTTYPFVAPPDVPPARVAIVRRAFDAVMKDPDFISDAHKIGMDVSPLSGADIEGIIADINAVPDNVMVRLKKLINS